MRQLLILTGLLLVVCQPGIAARCVDKSWLKWSIGDEYLGCTEYVDRFPCRCQLNGVNETCCQSCKHADCKACRDYLSITQWIKVYDRYGKQILLTDCNTLVKQHVYLCKKKYGQEGGHCCESCRQQDLSCVDENIYWFVGKGKQSCSEYVAGDICRCQNTEVAEKCCASCQGKVCDPCRDYLSRYNWIHILDSEGNVKEKLTDCAKLVNKYLYLCKKYGKPGDQCCDSCSQIDLSCIDDTSVTWYMNGDNMKCEEYVTKHPRVCKDENAKSTCCQSCKRLEESCADSQKRKVTLQVGTRKKAVKCKRCSCADIADKGEEFATKACKKKKIMKMCCQMCQDYM